MDALQVSPPLRLLSLIADRSEVCACALVETLGKSQPTVSHHRASD
jgi:DNA-binding transcriptional ArsR family regulator